LNDYLIGLTQYRRMTNERTVDGRTGGQNCYMNVAR